LASVFCIKSIVFLKGKSTDCFAGYIASLPCITKDKDVSAFRQHVVDRPFTEEGHILNVSNVHGAAAKLRSAARHYIESTIVSLGRVPFALNQSNSDIRKESDGNRQLRTAKDFAYYSTTSSDVPGTKHHLSAVDDLDWYTYSQYMDLLKVSIDYDSTLFSFMHIPTSAAFKSNEFSANFDPVSAKWKFACADGDGYEHELWDNTKPMTSHWSYGTFTTTKTILIALLCAAAGLATHAHLTQSLPLQISTPIGDYCYEWVPIQIPTLIQHDYDTTTQFTVRDHTQTHVYEISNIWNYVPRCLHLAVTYVVWEYPWRIQCPTDYSPIIASAAIAAATALVLCATTLLSGIRSGFHFNFHIDCGEGRTIWVQHPAVKFGLLHTLWHACEISQHLPRRLTPTLIKIPPSNLSPEGSTICAFTRITQNEAERVHTYNIANTDTSVELDSRGYNVIKSHNLNGKTLMTVAAFQTMYGECEWDSAEIKIAINAVTYEDGRTEVAQCHRQPSTTNYRFRVKDYVEEEQQPTLVAYFDGATRGCTYIAQNTQGNTEYGIQKRITEIRPEDLPRYLSRYQQNNINTFIREYRREVGNFVRLMSVDDVYEKQSKPSQRLSNLEAMSWRASEWLEYVKLFGKRTKSFQKSEVVMKPGDPRNITPMTPTVRLQNSRIALALASNMKKTRWYAFGLAPMEVATRVAEHVSDKRTRHIALGDYTRMDGTVNKLVREFDIAFLLSNFDPSDHPEVRTWYELTYGNSVNAGFGVRYDQDESQASGDPYTSALNTARNAFISYCCLLSSPIHNSEAKIDFEGAYRNLGLMAGDDSIQRNLDEQRSIATAATWGFKLKFKMANRGDQVDFLSRQYSPAVWMNHTDNICSPLRMLSKFHTSTNTSTMPQAIIAHTKAQSILTNDSETYLIGAWMKKIVIQTEEEYRAWCNAVKASRLALLDIDKQWNHKWALSFGSVRETSYQSGNQMDLDWQIKHFLREFEMEKLEEFEDFVNDPQTHWRDCPILIESDAKPAADTYIANGDIVEPSPIMSIISTEEEIVSIPPIPPHDHEEIVPDQQSTGLEQAKTNPAVSVCKRGTKNSGWYSGLAPCENVVSKQNMFCKVCNGIYLVNKNKKPPPKGGGGPR